MKRDFTLILIYAVFAVSMYELTRMHYEKQDEITEKFHKELLEMQGVDDGKEASRVMEDIKTRIQDDSTGDELTD